MTIIELLVQDHRETEQLFAQKDTAGLSRALRLHDRIETELLYPEASAAGVPGVDHAQEEHTKVRELLDRLDAGESGEDVLGPLQTAVAEHVREEENQLLPNIQNAVPAERLTELGEQAQQMKTSG